jgi:hypothetical protein
MKQWLSSAANDFYLGQEFAFFLLEPKVLYSVMFEALTEGNVKILFVLPRVVWYFTFRPD